MTVVVAVDQVQVPDGRGDRLDEATEELEERGPDGRRWSRAPSDGRVLGTWPLEGTEVSSGTPVDLVMRPGR